MEQHQVEIMSHHLPTTEDHSMCKRLARFLARFRRLAGAGTAVAGAFLAVMLVTAGPASAANLDNTNPMTTGCNSGAYTVGSNNLFTPSGQIAGRVELRYSPRCGTNWARVYSYVGARYLYTWSTRVRDGVTTWGGPGGDPGPYYGTSAYSDQLVGVNTVVCAYGVIYGVTYQNSYCA